MPEKEAGQDQQAGVEVVVHTGDADLEGDLGLVEGATGIVLFAHGSGSSRFSPRNRFVARHLRQSGLSTLLFDLLTGEEGEIDERTRELRFDIELLSRRVTDATDWIRRREETRTLNVGLFGASTGAAAALLAAARRPDDVAAVVSRGGRPDLAMEALPAVKAPTLLIVGGLDAPVIRMNETALAQLQAQKELRIVEGATHLFEEPGKLEEVAELAAGWFKRSL